MKQFKSGDIKLFLTSWPHGQLHPVKIIQKREGLKDQWYIEYLLKGGTDTTNSNFLFDMPDGLVSAETPELLENK